MKKVSLNSREVKPIQQEECTSIPPVEESLQEAYKMYSMDELMNKAKELYSFVAEKK